MKHLLILLLYISWLGCNQNTNPADKKPDSAPENHAAELIDKGFLIYADSSTLDSLKTRLMNSFDIYDERNYKIAHIDAEVLAEFSFDFFLPALNKILAKRNFTLSAQKLNDNDNSFDVLINSDTIPLYTPKDLESDVFWDRAPQAFFRKINDLLKIAGITEQFYLLYGGNDLHCLLLTDEQFSVIADYYKDNEREKPYKP